MSLGMPYTLTLSYRRPAQFVFEHKRSLPNGSVATKRFVVNDKELFETVSTAPDRYTHQVQPTFKGYTLQMDAFQVECDVKIALVPLLLDHEVDVSAAMMKDADAVSVGDPGVIDGVPTETVEITRGGDDLILSIGKQDHLLRKLASQPGKPSQSAEPPFSLTETGVTANPKLADATFQFVPPPNTVKVERLPRGAGADPLAVAIMRKMYDAYEALHTYSGSMRLSLRGMDGEMNTVCRAGFLLEKPAKINFITHTDQRTLRAICDGATLWVTSTSDDAHYAQIPLASDPDNQRWLLSTFGGSPGYGAEMSQWMPSTLLGTSGRAADTEDWRLAGKGAVNGEPVDTVTLRESTEDPSDYMVETLAVGSRDHLLRQVITEYFQKGASQSKEVETYSDIWINQSLPSSLFQFTPPSSMRPVPEASQLALPVRRK